MSTVVGPNWYVFKVIMVILVQKLIQDDSTIIIFIIIVTNISKTYNIIFGLLPRPRVLVQCTVTHMITSSLSVQSKLVSIERDLLSSHQKEKMSEESLAVTRIKSNSKYVFRYAK